MQKFNFRRLISKYSKEVTVIIPSKSNYDDSGDWNDTAGTEIKLTGAVIRHRQSKVYRSEGTITNDDYAFYLTTKPTLELVGSVVICDDKKFSVESVLNNSEWTGVWSYNLKYVSAFKEGGSND